MMENKIDDEILNLYIINELSIKAICEKLNIDKKEVKKILISRNLIKKNNSLGLEEFLRRAREKHGDKYDYSKVVYPKNNHEKVKIKCKKCGKEFEQSVTMHLHGYGCECQRNYFSTGELQIRDWLKSHNIRYEIQKRFENCKDMYCLPFDFYLPDYRVAIEFQGQQHFTINSLFTRKFSKKTAERKLLIQKKHDAIKRDYCLNNDILLIAIIYDEDVNDVLRKEYELFSNRYDKVDIEIIEQPITALSPNLMRCSVETTGTRHCEICGKEFEPPILRNGCRSNVKVCSRDCAEILRKKKSLKKHGYESHNQSPEIIAKQQLSNLKKYGTIIPSSLPEFKEKAKQTSLLRYGVDNPAKTQEVKEKISKANTKYHFTEEMNSILTKLYTIDNADVKEIAKLMKISYAKIKRQISKLNLHRSGSKLLKNHRIKNDVTKEKLQELKDQKLTYAQIMKITGLTEGTLSRRLKEFGLLKNKK